MDKEIEKWREKIPKHWEVKRLSDISLSVQYGYTESASKEAVGPKFLRITDIQNNLVNWEEVPYCKIDSNLIEKYLLKKGDLLFARTGATVGKSYLIKVIPYESIFASYLIRVRLISEINKNYVESFFLSPNYWSQITQGQVGIGQPNVNGTTLGKLKIPIPPLPEQEAIVAKIEELFSELDKGKEQLEIALAQLKVYRQSLLQAAFSGKLTDPDVKDGELPEGWKWVKLGDVCDISGGVTKGKKYKNPSELISLPYLRVANVQDGYLDLKIIKTINVTKPEKDKYLLKLGDILFTEGGDKDKLGRGAIWKNEIRDCIHQNHIFKARRIKDDASSEFISYYSNSSQGKDYFFKKAKQTTNLATINKNILINLPIPLPPIQEQEEIIQILESKLTLCDKMEETIRKSLKQCDVLRQSILKKAFEGSLVGSVVGG
jgi:type I restriction enzyme S subunit